MITISNELMQNLNKEIPILRAQIQAVYAELDKKFGLRGAKVPITFGFDTDTLGSYSAASPDQKEHFHFSLLFIGYSVKNPLRKEERTDLFKHEYAHYMVQNMPVPKQYLWQSGVHGSAWKYCCSLIGAAPTPFYKSGEAKQEHNYEKVLKSPVSDKMAPLKDLYRREQEARQKANSVVCYQVGDTVNHPSFGSGQIESIEPVPGSVRLHIRFGEDVKKIDQKWLLKSQYKKPQKSCRT